MPVIVIDPGDGGLEHVGGSDHNNSTSASGVEGKAMTLKLAQKIKLVIEGGACIGLAAATGQVIAVHLTRTGDRNLSLADRASVARSTGADIFLSLHFNSFDGKTRGTEAWIDRKYATAFKVSQAGKIRKVTDGPGDPTSGIRNINHVDDADLATALANVTFKTIQSHDRGARLRSTFYDAHHFGESFCPPPGVKMKGLGVLKDEDLGTTENNCRACLLEIEFIDHPAVDALFNGPQGDPFQDKLAAAIARTLIASI